jgi:hypothetical protein
MLRRAIGIAVIGLLCVGFMGAQGWAIPPVNSVQWVGGANGQWPDADAWKNITTNTTGDAAAIFGQGNGSDGMNTTSMATTRARNITIGGGNVVNYHGNMIGDLRIRQGSSLTIKDGAVWQQVTDGTFTENAWTQMDPSNLILDNGTFRRSGESPAGDGGGLVLFSSYRDDEAFEELGGPTKINVQIKNGGRIENTGQLWFGADDEHSPDTRVTFNINDGHMDLTGGTIPLSNSTLTVDADLAFFYDYSETALMRPKNEQWQINFTGPGSITVDSAGINVYRQDEFGVWTGGDPVSYQDLWNQGILTAHGLSGVSGVTVPSSINDNNRMRVAANFNDFFTVTGTPGTDNYKLTSITPTLQEVEYVGTSGGQWSDANAWKNVTTNTTGDAATILGRANGSNGMNTTSLATSHARNITIPANTTVNYHGNMIGDLRMNQGSTLTIRQGGVWQQVTDGTFTENSWTQFDGRLVLDGGTFRRSGESPAGDGGGIMMLGSYRDDESFEEIGGPAKITVEITNGGRLENTGQLWFGADDEHSPDARASITINNGHMDLTGGTIPQSNSTLTVDADLAFFYDYSETALMRPKNEEWEINFTGPGSITVDSAGINVYRQDEFGVWTGGDPVSYQDLWTMGILKANGLSGVSGVTVPSGINDNNRMRQAANFGDFFTVTGTPGMDNYILNSLIEGATPPGLTGDFNGNGVVDAADYVLWRNGGPLQNEGGITPGTSTPEDYTTWRANFGKSAAGGGAALGAAAVPEPATCAMLLALLIPVSLHRKRAAV